MLGDEKGAGGTCASTTVQAPKLRGATHYAAWKRDMAVWLERHGANGVHTRAMTASAWEHYAGLVAGWNNEKLEAAMARFSLGARPEASGSGGGRTGATTTAASQQLLLSMPVSRKTFPKKN